MSDSKVNAGNENRLHETRVVNLLALANSDSYLPFELMYSAAESPFYGIGLLRNPFLL